MTMSKTLAVAVALAAAQRRTLALLQHCQAQPVADEACCSNGAPGGRARLLDGR